MAKAKQNPKGGVRPRRTGRSPTGIAREPDVQLRARRKLEIEVRGITAREIAHKAKVTEGFVSVVFAGQKTSDPVMRAAHEVARERKVDPLPERLFPLREAS